MESFNDPSTHIRQMQRAEAAPYIDMPSAPWWASAFLGAWFAAFLAVYAILPERPLLFAILIMMMIIVLGWFIGWFTRKNGVFPRPRRGTPPPEIRRMYWEALSGLVVIACAVAGAWWWGSALAAVIVTFPLVTGGHLLYEVRYERAAAAVRERLA